MCDTGPSAPPAPNYAAAARETAQGNANAARIAQYGNMTNQASPYGYVGYTPEIMGYIDEKGNTITTDAYNALKNQKGYSPLEQWTQTVTLSPDQQKLFDQSVKINQELGDVAEGGVKYVQSAMDNPLKSQALASTPQSTADQMVRGVNLPKYQMALPDAGEIQSNIANAGNLIFNANLQKGVAKAGQIQSNIENAGNITSSIGELGSIQSDISPAGAIGSQIASAGDVTKSFYNPSDIATATGANQVARGFSPNNARQIQVNSGANQAATGYLPNNANQIQVNSGANKQATGDVYNTAGQLQTSVSNPNLLVQDTTNALYKQQAQFLDPQFEQAQSKLENQLANQGITRGSEAYNNAMQSFGNQKQQAYESARNQAIAGGINAAQGMFGMSLQGGQFTNQALGQAFGQNVTQKQLANTAANQNNQLALANQAATNQAIGQQFGQYLNAGNFANTAANQNNQLALANQAARNQALGQQYSQGLQGTQLANQAAAQNNAQALANANFYNQALQQAYQQNLGSANFQNQAQAQQFAQNQAALQAQNAAQAQLFGQNTAQQQAQNAAQQQAYLQALGIAGFQNQAQAQQFSQNQAALQAQNAAQAQNYSQLLNNAQFNNQAALQAAQLQNQTQAQQFAQNQAAQQAQNAAQAQLFGQNMAKAEFANQAAQGMFGASLQNAALQNQAAQAEYQQALQSGQFQNQTAAQALAQEQALQQNPINMLNAVRTGQQLQVAQMPQVGVSQPGQLANWQGPDMLGAAQAQGQYNQGIYNAKSAANSQLMSSLIGAGGALGAAAISDIRLKKNIVRLGTHKTLGIGLYIWDYIWGEKGAGVMAQELEKVMPEAVITMPDGYKAVNYSMLGA